MMLDDITLPDGLIWVDRYQWTPVQQSMAYALDGTLIIQEAAMLAGRPLTLEGGADQCWTTKSVIESLWAKTQTPSQVMTLTIGPGEDFSVMWRRDRDPISVEPVFRVTDPDNDTLFAVLALRFVIVG